ncbi:MAG: alpha/beta hydrolase [Acidobacteriota bacterium]|nr:alpha/beta hydrolase [Acidobacteriota bacterium]
MRRYVDRGSGPAVVLLPGIQGRWQFLSRTVEALAAHGCRVLTFSLGRAVDRGEPVDPVRGYARDMARIDAMLDEAGLDRAALCGSSAGGPVALQYAATRPGKVTALVLASAPGPRWAPDPELRAQMRRPWLNTLVFLAGTRARLAPEIRVAFPRRLPRLAFTLRQVITVLRAPIVPSWMAERARLMQAIDLAALARQVQAPTLLVTGEPGLDRVVPVAQTHEYLKLIPEVRAVTLERTGHIGLVTQPDRFAGIVATFVHEAAARVHETGQTQTHG